MSKFSNTSVSIDLSARSLELIKADIVERVQAAMERANIGLDEKTAARLEELIALGSEKFVPWRIEPEESSGQAVNPIGLIEHSRGNLSTN
jgi:hypothetical protein